MDQREGGGPGAAASGSRRVAVVTGASAGIGRATAVELARRGHDVALLARGSDGLDAAAREIKALGGRALTIPVDTAEPEQVFAAADEVAARWGRIDLWVNNAMATVFGPIDAIPPAEFRRVTEVTYLGVVHGTLAALRHMRPRDAGTIVQIGSALAYRSIPLQAPYCGAKAAIRGFTDSLRCELLHQGSRIKVTMVQLPGVNTPQFSWSRTHMPRRHQPVGACYQPEAVARRIADAAQNAPREAWVGLPAMQAIVGSMLAPGLLDRYLATTAYAQQMAPPSPNGEDWDILFEPAGDFGTHGRFDAKASDSVSSADPLWLRGGLALAALGAVAGAFLLGSRSGAAGRPRLPAGRSGGTNPRPR